METCRSVSLFLKLTLLKGKLYLAGSLVSKLREKPWDWEPGLQEDESAAGFSSSELRRGACWAQNLNCSKKSTRKMIIVPLRGQDNVGSKISGNTTIWIQVLLSKESATAK